MKKVKWKILIITSAVCLLPVLLGVIFWNDLPDLMAVHFNFNNEPDNFAKKPFAVFGLPFIMVLMQIFCCIVNDINSSKYGENKKFDKIAKWIIPVMSIILETAIIFVGLGKNVDIRIVAAVIVGITFIALGHSMAELNYIKNYKVEPEKARKINKFVGRTMVVMGILMLITIFLPPIATVIWLILLAPYTLVCAVYGIKSAKEK